MLTKHWYVSLILIAIIAVTSALAIDAKVYEVGVQETISLPKSTCINGVKYWAVKTGYHQSGITPAFNTDGSVMLCE